MATSQRRVSDCVRVTATAIACLLGLIASVPVIAGEGVPSAQEVLKQTREAYAALSSYSSVGEVASVLQVAGSEPQESHHQFAIKLARPQRYLIEWERRMPNLISKGAAWSMGEEYLMTVPGQEEVNRAKDLPTALAMATGVSAGAAGTVPVLFFGIEQGALKYLADVRISETAIVEGDECYVLAGGGKDATTLWISKESKLIRQQRREVGGSAVIPRFRDEDIRQTLKAMNREPTKDAIKGMKAQLEVARQMARGMSGSFTEIYRDIVVNAPIADAEFAPTASISPR